MKLTVEHLQAITALSADRNFQVVVQIISDLGEQWMQELIYADKDRLASCQGKAQAATEILKTIIEAPAKLKQLK